MKVPPTNHSNALSHGLGREVRGELGPDCAAVAMGTGDLVKKFNLVFINISFNLNNCHP